MADLITNNNGSNSGVSFTSSEMKIGLGNKLLIDAGAVNTIILGDWNRLIAGVSNEIQLGTSAEIIMANTVDVGFGNSYTYLNQQHNIIANSDSKMGIRQLLFTSGVSVYTKNILDSQRIKATNLSLAIITSYIITLGISLVSNQYPPFVQVINENGAIKSEINVTGMYLTLFDVLAILGVFLTQLFAIKLLLPTNSHQINAVSNLSLAANGITSAVFSEPENQPQLILANTTDKDYDHYTPNKSPYAIFNILPNAIDPQEPSNSFNLNWRNTQHGIYPRHYENSPVITLAVETPVDNLELNPSTYESENTPLLPYLNRLDETFVSSVNILPHKLLVNSYSQNKLFDSTKSANLVLDISESGNQFTLDSYSNGYGGEIRINNENTTIYRNDDSGFIEIAFQDHLAQEYQQPPQNSILQLANNRALITTNDHNTGILIDDEVVSLKAGQNTTSITFDNQCHINIENKTYYREKNQIITASAFTLKTINNESHYPQNIIINRIKYRSIEQIKKDNLELFKQINNLRAGSCGFSNNLPQDSSTPKDN